MGGLTARLDGVMPSEGITVTDLCWAAARGILAAVWASAGAREERWLFAVEFFGQPGDGCLMMHLEFP